MSETISISICFRHIEHSNDLVVLIETEARALQRRHPELQNCSVIIEKRHRRHRTANAIRARVSVGVPGRILISAKTSTSRDESTGAAAALSHAFDAAEHALVTHQSRLRARHGHQARFCVNPAMG